MTVSENMKNLFLLEMKSQGITTLEELFILISNSERDKLVETVCTDEFIKEYKSGSKTI